MFELPWWAWILIALELVLIVLLFLKWEEPMITGVKLSEEEENGSK